LAVSDRDRQRIDDDDSLVPDQNRVELEETYASLRQRIEHLVDETRQRFEVTSRPSSVAAQQGAYDR
jgi:hypothetical protein